jgi:glycosyltransferase involved in cell wall biosynthesis
MWSDALSVASQRGTIKVALDTSFAGVNTTGVGIYSARLASALEARSHELGIQLCCYGPSCDPWKSSKSSFAMAQEWPLNTHVMLPLRLLRDKPTVTHSTSHIGPLWGPGKLVVTVHDLIFRRYPEDYSPAWLWITRLTLPAILRRAHTVIADSYATKSDIERFYRVRHSKIVVIYPGVDEAYALQRGTGDRSVGRPYVLCLGPWVRRKNLQVVVRAFAQLALQIPDLDLAITGTQPAGMKGYSRKELVDSLPDEIRSRAKLMGYVAREELPRLVANAAALAYPSRWEGFGLPPLEAMSAGVPVIASKTPAVEEVTAGGAYLCDPDNVSEWVEAFRRILLDRGCTERMVEAGLRRSADFTWERCAAQTAQVYHRVARARIARGGKRQV